MMIEDDFMLITSHTFSKMRLMIEGAITMFEDDASILCRLARDANQHDANCALNDIGTALYGFREQVKMLQEEHRKETQRQSQSHA